MSGGLESPTAVATQERASELLPWLLHADGEGELRAEAERLRTDLGVRAGATALEVARELAAGHDELEHRAVVIGGTREELEAGLTALADGEPSSALVTGRATPGKAAFMFTGQGAQRPGMGGGVYGVFPVFARALDDACAVLDEHLGRRLGDLLNAERGSDDAELLNHTEYTQASLFAIEVALFRLAEAFGLEADYLIGHSIGELTAAHAAGVLSLEDAGALVAARGRLMGALPPGGAMISVRAGEDEVVASLGAFGGRLDIAAVNAPESVVVSGDEDAAEEWAERMGADGRKTTRLRVSHAFHSRHMEPMLDAFRAIAAAIDYREPRIPIVSNLTGEVAPAEQLCSADHWVRHVREAVRFADGARCLQGAGVTRFLELGPDGILSSLARSTVGDDGAFFAPALRGRRPEPRALLNFLAGAHVHGARVDWAPVLAGA